MPSHPLPNYLRAHRKRLGLSQDDLAYLLGCRSGTKVSRYERFRRQPHLATVFAFEAIARVPARTLFAGVYVTAERDVVRRAEALLRQLAGQPESLRHRRRIVALKAIIGAVTGGDDGESRSGV
jgi:transcriptional regulator with XRE-family HTH domain